MTTRAEPPAPLDPLARFLKAQQDSHPQALAELHAGRKQAHWIRYVLPQLRELGRSELARRYGISGREEAAAYMAHPVLGPRLDCVPLGLTCLADSCAPR